MCKRERRVTLKGKIHEQRQPFKKYSQIWQQHYIVGLMVQYH